MVSLPNIFHFLMLDYDQYCKPFQLNYLIQTHNYDLANLQFCILDLALCDKSDLIFEYKEIAT